MKFETKSAILLLSLLTTQHAFADGNIVDEKIAVRGSGVVSRDTNTSATLAGWTVGAALLERNKQGNTIDLQFNAGAVAPTAGKDKELPNGSEPVLIGDVGIKANFTPLGKDEKKLKINPYLDFNLVKASPFIRSSHLNLGLELQWGSGAVGFELPAKMMQDRVHDVNVYGLGVKLLGRQNIGNLLTLKAALEANRIGNENTSGSYASASGGIELHLGKQLSIEASAIAENMSTKRRDSQYTIVGQEQKTKSVTPVTGIATATFAF